MEKETSDVDLLVVVPDSDLPRHRREAISYDLLWGMTAPVDVIVLTRAEFQRASRVKTSQVWDFVLHRLPPEVRVEMA